MEPHGSHYRGTPTNNPPIHHMLLTTTGHVKSRQAGRGQGLLISAAHTWTICLLSAADMMHFSVSPLKRGSNHSLPEWMTSCLPSQTPPSPHLSAPLSNLEQSDYLRNLIYQHTVAKEQVIRVNCACTRDHRWLWSRRLFGTRNPGCRGCRRRVGR